MTYVKIVIPIIKMKISVIKKLFFIFIIFIIMLNIVFSYENIETTDTYIKKLTDYNSIIIGNNNSENILPEFEINLLNNNIRFKIYYNISGNSSLKNNILNVSDSTQDVLIYEFDKNKIEFGIILNKKPLNNIFKFPIEYENLNFYYQSKLNESNLETLNYTCYNETFCRHINGAIIYRPEEYVNSYAVYYLSNKIFDILRIKINDSKGKKTYCDMNIKDNTLYADCPKNFLNNAVYPVFLDPVFSYGYSIKGSTVVERYANDIIVSDWHGINQYNGTITQFHGYIGYRSGSTGNITFVMYQNDTTNPYPKELRYYGLNHKIVGDGNTYMYNDTGLNNEINSSVGYYLGVHCSANYCRFSTDAVDYSGGSVYDTGITYRSPLTDWDEAGDTVWNVKISTWLNATINISPDITPPTINIYHPINKSTLYINGSSLILNSSCYDENINYFNISIYYNGNLTLSFLNNSNYDNLTIIKEINFSDYLTGTYYINYTCYDDSSNINKKFQIIYITTKIIYIRGFTNDNMIQLIAIILFMGFFTILPLIFRLKELFLLSGLIIIVIGAVSVFIMPTVAYFNYIIGSAMVVWGIIESSLYLVYLKV